MVELGTHPATERADAVTLHLSVRAPDFYPDNRTHGSEGGEGDEPFPTPIAEEFPAPSSGSPHSPHDQPQVSLSFQKHAQDMAFAYRHSLERGNPVSVDTTLQSCLDARFHGHDEGVFGWKKRDQS